MMMLIAVLRQHWVVSYATASALAVIVVQWRRFASFVVRHGG